MFEEWDYQEVISYWIALEEDKYQEQLSQMSKEERRKHPTRLFTTFEVTDTKEIAEANKDIIDFVKSMNKINGIR